MLQRGSGILLHLSSLPSPYGIGDLGPEAERFIEFLAKARQSYWQFLPLGPTDGAFGHSPYMSLSAHAGNPLLISPDLLVEDGLLRAIDLQDRPTFSEYLVDWEPVRLYKQSILAKAFRNFLALNRPPAGFEEFCRANVWLNDYALFMSIRETEALRPWPQWPDELAGRHPVALSRASRRLAERIHFRQFEQYCFARQWERLRRLANERGILLIGDIPIYVSADSADAWANQDCFLLDPLARRPTHVAGVPPDYFSATGQRWGNPLYRWFDDRGRCNEALQDWWRIRFEQIRRLVDVVRIDHFRGFESYWSVPAEEETAVRGTWIKGPGKAFFDGLASSLSGLEVIAEDLGIITPAVEKLRDSLHLPGMKILQFAFDSDQTNAYLPHNYTTSNCVVFTGTHDNDTTLGWFMGEAAPLESKRRALRYANSRDGAEISWDFIRMAFASVAAVAIIPLQDVLGFGGDCRMNTPGTTSGNWRWRVAPRFINDAVCQRLRSETIFYARQAPESAGGVACPEEAT